MARTAAPRPQAAATPGSRLHAIRNRYGVEATATKLSLISRLERTPPRAARGLCAYHDDLLFLCAFPDDSAVLASAGAGLLALRRRVRSLTPAVRRSFADTGMPGSVTSHAFSFGLARWLVDAGEDADIDWDALEAPERLDPLLRLTLTQAESDAFDSGEVSTRQWMTMARAGSRRGALRWLLRSPAAGAPPQRSAPDTAVMRLLYESVDAPVRWHLSAAWDTAGNVVATRRIVVRSFMRPTPPDAASLIAAPLPGIRRLSRVQAAPWLDAARAALAVRCREVHAITYANPDEIYLADLGEGTAVCLIGAARDDRLTLEANYGYVLFANGVPVGYGGVTPLASQANTGVNIFESFRHAEAAMLFTQALRAFRTLFGVTRFIVNPYQFGAGNDEAVDSGAFWFYDRLGFRSREVAVRRLADRERRRLAASRKHRSAASTLRRLAAGDLVLELPGSESTALVEERWLVTIASAVTESLAAPDQATRLARRDALTDVVARALHLDPGGRARGALAFGLQRLAPVMALILDDIRGWPAPAHRQLVALIAAKGGPRERDFAVASREHARLWQSLGDFCRDRDRR